MSIQGLFFNINFSTLKAKSDDSLWGGLNRDLGSDMGKEKRMKEVSKNLLKPGDITNVEFDLEAQKIWL